MISTTASEIGKNLSERFRVRIDERHNGELVYLFEHLIKHSYIDQLQDQFGQSVKRQQTATVAKKNFFNDRFLPTYQIKARLQKDIKEIVTDRG